MSPVGGPGLDSSRLCFLAEGEVTAQGEVPHWESQSPYLDVQETAFLV